MGRASSRGTTVERAHRQNRRHLTPALSLPDQETAEALYNWVHTSSGIEAVVEEYDPSGSDSIEVKGALMRGRKQIGEFTRWMSLYPHVVGIDDAAELITANRLVAKNSWLKIYGEADRRQGFGRAYTEELEKRYRELGVHRVEVLASNDGAWAWLRSGYRFHVNDPYPPNDPRYPVTPLSEAEECARRWHSPTTQEIVDRLLADGRITPEQVQATTQRFLAQDSQVMSLHEDSELIMTPQQWSELGEESTWEEDGERMWLGKAIFMNPGVAERGWRGWKLL
jgi:hypothetical protein